MTRFVNPFAPVARAGAAGRSPRPVDDPPPQPQPPADEPRNPERMTKDQLIAWARELGLSTSGTKAELVARIRAAV